MPSLTFSVNGTPRPQPRPRLVKGRVVSVADDNAKRWISSVESSARLAVANKPDTSGPLEIQMVFRMPTPRKERHGAPHTFKPDVDNLAKLALDAMMRAGLIKDDSSVSSIVARKVWSPDAGADFVISGDKPAPRPNNAVPPPEWVGGFG